MAETTTQDWKVSSSIPVGTVRTNLPKVTVHNQGRNQVGVRVQGVPLENVPAGDSKPYLLPTNEDVLVEVVFLKGPSNGVFEFEIFN